MTEPKIALISATPLAIEPAAEAVSSQIPNAVIWNLLDDRLLKDAQQEGGVTAPLAARMDDIIDLAIRGGSVGVLLTCSQFGERAERRDAAIDKVPVLSADGPLFGEIVERRPTNVLLVASLEAAAVDSTERLSAALRTAGVGTQVTPLLVLEAAHAERGRLADVLATAIGAHDAPYDAVVLAQYSLAPAAIELADRVSAPVFDGPRAAARRLHTMTGSRS